MSGIYFIKSTSDGGFAVQEHVDGLEEFHSYHRTREAAEAAMAGAYRRDAADDLFAACEAAEKMRTAQRKYFKSRDYAHDLPTSIAAEKHADTLIAAALSKARGELTQGGLLP